MKILLILHLISALSCTPTSKLATRPSDTRSPEVYARARVGSYDLTLTESEGICSLEATKDGAEARSDMVSIPFDMIGPCNFIRKPGKQNEPMSFEYISPRKQIILMVVGGPPDASRTDVFFPKGCGTELQAVRVLDGAVEVTDKINPGYYGATCPSKGLDENFFAAEVSGDLAYLGCWRGMGGGRLRINSTTALDTGSGESQPYKRVPTKAGEERVGLETGERYLLETEDGFKKSFLAKFINFSFLSDQTVAITTYDSYEDYLRNDLKGQGLFERMSCEKENNNR